MRKSFLALLLLLPFCVQAVEYAELQDSTSVVSQIRIGADCDWKWDYVGINFSEELRFNLSPTPEAYLANTTVGMDVKIVKGYLSAHALYMLRVRANKFSTGDVSKILRHRVAFGLTQHVKLGELRRITLSLRERAVLNMRFDEPNLYEKQAFAWEMRYRLQLQYKAASLPLTPYIWTELDHTCNATDFQKYYNGGRNFITASKTALGLKWRLNTENSLNFYLRYDWARDFDIDANKSGSVVKLATQAREHTIIIGATYDFGWKKR